MIIPVNTLIDGVSYGPPERVRIKGIGGSCPVQGEGWVAGEEFYFRARWAGWSIEFGDQGEPPLRTHAEGYREELEHAAGYMPVEEAEAFVRREAARFIAEVIGPEVSEREQEMWRFLPNVAYGPFEAVDLSMIRTGCASYNCSSKAAGTTPMWNVVREVTACSSRPGTSAAWKCGASFGSASSGSWPQAPRAWGGACARK
ncbi:hypothetical protein [Caulobacter endophyticus]|uniref:hypothetical protein n=1 Tax=Caulobacter endophyticus TaxID=2172652 RepID=UPI001E65C492|nr:hypothetical protein [Caulobacter endophyticus]